MFACCSVKSDDIRCLRQVAQFAEGVEEVAKVYRVAGPFEDDGTIFGL